MLQFLKKIKSHFSQVSKVLIEITYRVHNFILEIIRTQIKLMKEEGW